MLPEERDAAHLWDMRQAARDALALARDVTLEELRHSRFHQYALAKAIELVGESAGRVSVPFRDSHPQIPWKEIVGMRNRLVHDYHRIDFNVVWDVVSHDLPGLVEALDALVPPSDDPV